MCFRRQSGPKSRAVANAIHKGLVFLRQLDYLHCTISRKRTGGGFNKATRARQELQLGWGQLD